MIYISNMASYGEHSILKKKKIPISINFHRYTLSKIIKTKFVTIHHNESHKTIHQKDPRKTSSNKRIHSTRLEDRLKIQMTLTITSITICKLGNLHRVSQSLILYSFLEIRSSNRCCNTLQIDSAIYMYMYRIFYKAIRFGDDVLFHNSSHDGCLLEMTRCFLLLWQFLAREHRSQLTILFTL